MAASAVRAPAGLRVSMLRVPLLTSGQQSEVPLVKRRTHASGHRSGLDGCHRRLRPSGCFIGTHPRKEPRPLDRSTLVDTLARVAVNGRVSLMLTRLVRSPRVARVTSPRTCETPGVYSRARLRQAAAGNESSLPSIRSQEPADSDAAIVADVVGLFDGGVGVVARDGETPEMAAGGGGIKATVAGGGGVVETAGAALDPQAAKNAVQNIPATDLRTLRNLARWVRSNLSFSTQLLLAVARRVSERPYD